MGETTLILHTAASNFINSR